MGLLGLNPAWVTVIARESNGLDGGKAMAYYTPPYTRPYTRPKIMSKTKPFKPYPMRRITIANPVWVKFKTAKLKSRLTWTNFIASLLLKT